MPTINGKACVANGRNLIVQSDLKHGYLDRGSGGINIWGDNFCSDNFIATNGETTFTFSSPDYAFKGSSNHTLAMYDSDKKYLGYKPIASVTQTLSKSNVAYIRFSMNFAEEGGTSGELSDWLSTHRYKLEKGSVATPLAPAPVDKVFSNGKQVYGRNLLSGTSNQEISATIEPNRWGPNNVHQPFPVTPGQTLTYSIFITADNTIDLNIGIDVSLGSVWKGVYIGNVIKAGTSGRSSLTVTIPSGVDNITPSAAKPTFTRANATTVYWKEEKLDLGTIVTPWTPAPEDVM